MMALKMFKRRERSKVYLFKEFMQASLGLPLINDNNNTQN